MYTFEYVISFLSNMHRYLFQVIRDASIDFIRYSLASNISNNVSSSFPFSSVYTDCTDMIHFFEYTWFIVSDNFCCLIPITNRNFTVQLYYNIKRKRINDMFGHFKSVCLESQVMSYITRTTLFIWLCYIKLALYFIICSYYNRHSCCCLCKLLCSQFLNDTCK